MQGLLNAVYDETNRALRVTGTNIVTNSTMTGAVTVNCNNATRTIVLGTLTGNVTSMSIDNLPVGGSVVFRLTQDATGSRTVVWDTESNWPAGTAPTLSTDPSTTDVISGFRATSSDIDMALVGLAFA